MKSLMQSLALAAFFAAHTALGAQALVTNSCPRVDNFQGDTEISTIAFDGRHSKTLSQTLQMLGRYHYNEIDLDNDFSRAFLDEYLGTLDPFKRYLSGPDVRRIRRTYATVLDDHIRRADLSPAQDIYLQWRRRAIARIERNLAMLGDDEHRFDFDLDEQLPLDAENHSWHKNASDADDYWRKSLKLSLLNMMLSGADEADARENLSRRLRGVLRNIKRTSTAQVLESYLNSMTRLYDPHTNYFSPVETENFDINMSLSLEGIGAILQTSDNLVRVVSLVDGGPAASQGELKVDDRISAVGEGDDCPMIDIMGWSINEVVQLVRGRKNSKVRLRVIPAGTDLMSGESRLVSVVRDEVKLENSAASSDVIEVQRDGHNYRMGVITIPLFYMDMAAFARRDPNYRSVTRDVQNLIKELRQQEGGIDGLVIDLRRNGGGSLDEAQRLTDLFIDPGPVVQWRHRKSPVPQRGKARTAAWYDGPMVVLIGRLTASASEIFAGAIQDYGRGLIVGAQSFGKGTVQGIYPLEQGQIKMTQSKFYRVTGDSTQRHGVTPDIALPSLLDDNRIGEETQDHALPWDSIRSVPHRVYRNFAPLVETLRKKHRQRAASDPGLAYMQGSLELRKSRRERTHISTNQGQREQEQKLWREQNDALRTAWRTARGLPAEPGDDEDDSPDILLDESAAIFVDMLQYERNQRPLARRKDL